MSRENCARCGRPEESLIHDRRSADPERYHAYETQEEVDTAFAEAAAIFTGRCVHCVSGTIFRDGDGPFCLQCGWRPTRAPREDESNMRARGRVFIGGRLA